MRRVGTFIFGRPRPLSGDRRADPNYTLDPEEPVHGQLFFLTGHRRERKGALSLGRVLAVVRPWQIARASLPGEQDQEAIMPCGSMMYFSCEPLSKSA